MPDYFCHNCGGRTAMMGHKECRTDLVRIIDRVVAEIGAARHRVVAAIGLWQLGELSADQRRIMEGC